MIKYNDVKLTANEFAKIVVFDKGLNYEYWTESCEYEDVEKMATDKEQENINIAIVKQLKRIRNFLNIDTIYNKVDK